MNKKGASWIEILVYVIISLAVLLLVLASFSTGFLELMKKLTGIGSAIPSSEVAVSTCKTFCESNSTSYCTQEFSGDIAGKKCPELYSACPTANRVKMSPTC